MEKSFGPAIRLEAQGGVWTIALHRPEVKNAVDRQTADALSAAFTAFEQEEEAKVAVLWGEGGVFCAGADLKAIAKGEPNRIQPTGDGPMGPTRMKLSKPVIAAIEGPCVAGGLELALWCDLRVAAEGAIFGVACRRWGVPLIDGGTVRLPRLIGQSRAMDMILTGRDVDAREALAMGLVNRLAQDGHSRQVAEELARLIASFPQMCMRADRHSARNQWSLDEASAIEAEYVGGVAVIDSGETEAGAQRFAQGAGRHGKWEVE